MANFEKICPSCGKREPANGVFCTGCGTNLQAVAPTPTQASAALNQAASIFSSAAGSLGAMGKKVGGFSLDIPFKRVIPLFLAILNFIFFVGYPTVTIKELDDPLLAGASFADICNEGMIEHMEFWGVLVVIFFILSSLLALGGSVLHLLEKPIGNFLMMGGAFFTIVNNIVLFIYFGAESDGFMVPTFTAFVVIFIAIALIAIGVISFLKSLPGKAPKAKAPAFQQQAPAFQQNPYQQAPAYQQNPYQQSPYQQNPYQQNPYQQNYNQF